MTTQYEEQSCEELQSLFNDSEHLPHTREILESSATVMDEHGNIRYKDPVNTDWPEVELAEYRKKLVLGLGKHEEHCLSKANEIIKERRENFFEEDNRSPVGKIKRFITRQ